jgi:DNA topoisomerase-1
MISAGIGRYGPFVLHDGTYANLETVEDVFSIGLNRAVTVIAEKLAKGPGRGRGTPTALKALGDHPDGGPITVRDGKYGPYVNWGKINATLPKDKVPADVTVEEALEMIAAKAGASGKKTKAPAKKAAKPKAKAIPPRQNQPSQKPRRRRRTEFGDPSAHQQTRQAGRRRRDNGRAAGGVPTWRHARPRNDPAVFEREPGPRHQA